MEDSSWIRLNVYLRVAVVILLICIGLVVVYNKIGYVDPDTSQIRYDLGNNITKVISCRDALYYYADKELHVYEKKNITYKYPDYNYSSWNISK